MEIGTGLFDIEGKVLQPDKIYTFNHDEKYLLRQQFLALLVGLIALGLPFFMLTGYAAGTCFYDSISHFYYSQFFGDGLVVSLAVIGTFLIAFRGENGIESIAATWAGFGAFGVALFPTTKHGCAAEAFSGRPLVDMKVESVGQAVKITQATKPGEFFQLFEAVGIIHYLSATALFAFLAYYCFVIFRRIIEKEHYIGGKKENGLTAIKLLRNKVYFWSGVVIVISIIFMGAHGVLGNEWEWWDNWNLTFWFESLALWAFGITWMVKGRFLSQLSDQRDKVARGAKT